MVCINTNRSKIQFKHFVEVPSADCVIGTAHDESKKIKLFLIVNGSGPIYKRNGINSTWDELSDPHAIRNLVQAAYLDERIPRYSTDSLSVLN